MTKIPIEYNHEGFRDPLLALVLEFDGGNEKEDDSTQSWECVSRLEVGTCQFNWHVLTQFFCFECYGKCLSSSETRLFLSVMEMMPPATKCVCGQVRTMRDMSDQLTRSIRLMQSNRANWGAF